mgnify:CR=1 FL=1
MLERLKRLRSVLSLTQAEFAEKLGIKQSTYSSIESGRYKLTDRYISQICMIFNVNENWIRTGEGPIFENVAKKQEMFELFSKLTPESQDYMLDVLRSFLKHQK